MHNNNSFTSRFNYGPVRCEIFRREEAPVELRSFIVQLLYDYQWSALDIRKLLCRVVRMTPDANNWGDDYIDSEIHGLITDAKWYKIYEFIERAYARVGEDWIEDMSKEINNLLIELGLGWKFEDGKFEFRGDDNFETLLQQTVPILDAKGLTTTKNEIEQALNDLKPDQIDVTGAIQHSMAALECLCREKAGSKDTLGKLLNKHKNLIPEILSDGVVKIYAFTCENARHLTETGIKPSIYDAELTVNLAVSLCRYLAQSLPNKAVGDVTDDGFPF